MAKKDELPENQEKLLRRLAACGLGKGLQLNEEERQTAGILVRRKLCSRSGFNTYFATAKGRELGALPPYTYVALGSDQYARYFGIGNSAELAIARLKRAGATTAQGKIVLYRTTDPNVEYDNAGIRWSAPHDRPVHVDRLGNVLVDADCKPRRTNVMV